MTRAIQYARVGDTILLNKINAIKSMMYRITKGYMDAEFWERFSQQRI